MFPENSQVESFRFTEYDYQISNTWYEAVDLDIKLFSIAMNKEDEMQITSMRV